jgi:UDP-N-acetylmuramoylalanine--D-glutamate ligase
MNTFGGERFLVIGMGVAGSAAARVLAEEGGIVRVTEERTDVDTADLQALGVEVRTGGHRPEDLDGVQIVVPSPGVPERAPILEWAAERGIPVWSELDIGARLCSAPFVAVTGTNGKSTTTKLVAEMMRSAGLDAAACGNIGHPFSVAAREGHEALAVETSSFQLRFHHVVHPRVSILLNVAPDHLDWHGSLGSYAGAKERIFELQGDGDVHVGNADDEPAAEISRRSPCRVVWFRRAAPGPGEVGVIDGEIVALFDGREIRFGRPVHDAAGFIADCAAACAAGLAFGLEPEPIRRALRDMVPLPHRGEEVARVEGVRFLDDSKATNVHAALHALEGKRDVVLIAGGMAKGVDLSPLAEALGSLAAVVAIGESASEVVAIFDGLVPTRKAGSIEEAVRTASELARPGGTVLLAPACASWDMFHDYTERGNRFRAAVQELAKETGSGDR